MLLRTAHQAQRIVCRMLNVDGEAVHAASVSQEALARSRYDGRHIIGQRAIGVVAMTRRRQERDELLALRLRERDGRAHEHAEAPPHALQVQVHWVLA